MPTTVGSNFSPVLVSDIINKVRGKSSVAALSAQTPIPFNGLKEFTFNFDKEVDIVAEGGAKSEGGISISPITIVPIKFEYGARVSDEFLFATEEAQIDILKQFNDGFARSVAKGLDKAVFHGVNPRTGTASAVIGTNHFDSKVTQTVTYDATKPDENLSDAVTAIHANDGDVTGMALSTEFGSAMANLKANGVVQYPEFKFGANPETLGGMKVSVNKTVSANASADRAIVGDFENAFKWGYSKEIPMKLIEYGDPDNSGDDLQGHNQVYIRSEVYIGWGILVPDYFVRIAAAA